MPQPAFSQSQGREQVDAPLVRHAEPARQHADDRVCFTIDPRGPANRVRIGTELFPPESFG
jgi:hypothetical protein